MGDIRPNDNDDQGNDGEQSPGDLRAQLEAEKEKNKRLTSENSSYKQKDQLRDLGFGHLSERQSRVLLRELAEDQKDLSEENVTSIATDLGYPTEPPKPRQQQQQGDQNGDGQQESNEEDEELDDSLSAIALMQRAGNLSASTKVSTDFSNQMKGTNSKEELRDLIRTKGPRHGIMHEWDVP